MNNLAEICLLGLGVAGNYARCLVISIGRGRAKRCGRGFKVIILMGKGARHKEETSFYGGS